MRRIIIALGNHAEPQIKLSIENLKIMDPNIKEEFEIYLDDNGEIKIREICIDSKGKNNKQKTKTKDRKWDTFKIEGDEEVEIIFIGHHRTGTAEKLEKIGLFEERFSKFVECCDRIKNACGEKVKNLRFTFYMCTIMTLLEEKRNELARNIERFNSVVLRATRQIIIPNGLYSVLKTKNFEQRGRHHGKLTLTPIEIDDKEFSELDQPMVVGGMGVGRENKAIFNINNVAENETKIKEKINLLQSALKELPNVKFEDIVLRNVGQHSNTTQIIRS